MSNCLHWCWREPREKYWLSLLKRDLPMLRTLLGTDWRTEMSSLIRYEGRQRYGTRTFVVKNWFERWTGCLIAGDNMFYGGDFHMLRQCCQMWRKGLYSSYYVKDPRLRCGGCHETDEEDRFPGENRSENVIRSSCISMTLPWRKGCAAVPSRRGGIWNNGLNASPLGEDALKVELFRHGFYDSFQ